VEELKLACLDRALSRGEGWASDDEVLALARKFYDFVTGGTADQ